MPTHHQALKFAQDWIAAWNSHDLDRVLSHYSHGFEMSSPFIKTVAGNNSGTLQGKAAVGAYWKEAFHQFPDLRFELIEAYAGVNSICIVYKSVQKLRAIEWFEFDASGLIRRAMAHYNQ